MRVVIGQKISARSSGFMAPRGAASGVVAGCGCGGGAGARPNPVGGAGWNKTYGQSYGAFAPGNPAPQARVGVRYGTSTRSQPRLDTNFVSNAKRKGGVCWELDDGRSCCAYPGQMLPICGWPWV